MLGVQPVAKPGIKDYAVSGPQEHRFNPYRDNGGTTAAIAGEDFVVIASDTRLGSGSSYGIRSRTQSKLFQLNSKMVLGSTGCWADVLALTKNLNVRIQYFKYTHNQEIPTSDTAQLLANMLYAKRFFPYYVTNILGGLDDNGRGVVYRYDPVGFMEELIHGAGGSAVSLIQPFMDNQVEKKNSSFHTGPVPRMTLEEAERCIHDAFISAAEREIHVGDSVHFKIITKDGIQEKYIMLRRD